MTCVDTLVVGVGLCLVIVMFRYEESYDEKGFSLVIGLKIVTSNQNGQDTEYFHLNTLDTRT